MRLPPATEPRLSFAAFGAPFQRLADIPGWGWVWGILAGAAQLVREDLFVGALCLLLIASGADYYFGRRVAKHRHDYNPALARAGAWGKAMAIALLILVRLFEYWGTEHRVVPTKGFVATAIAVGLFALELESIAHHREALGARPIPLLGQVIGLIRSAAERMVGRPAERKEKEGQ